VIAVVGRNSGRRRVSIEMRMVFRHLPPPNPERDRRATGETALVVLACSPQRRERERRAAVIALADAYTREAALVGRFEAMIEGRGRDRQPVLTREVDAVLQARDWALARLQEWSA